MSLAHQGRLLIAATQFLTRLPTPRLDTFEPDWVTRGARYFPLVGQAVGAISGAAFLLGAGLWSSAVAAVLALAAGVLVTGALHEDGLADSADGLFGGGTPERRLEIMKDSRIGAFGVLALILMLGLKAAALAGLSAVEAAWTLVALHGVSRAAAVCAMRWTAYAPAGRPTRWTPAEQGVRASELAIALALAAWPLVLLPPAAALAGVTGAGLGAVAVVALAQRKLGGHTGDILGAVEQMAGLGFLLGAAWVLA